MGYPFVAMNWQAYYFALTDNRLTNNIRNASKHESICRHTLFLTHYLCKINVKRFLSLSILSVHVLIVRIGSIYYIFSTSNQENDKGT